jgi:hypothetical protein
MIDELLQFLSENIDRAGSIRISVFDVDGEKLGEHSNAAALALALINGVDFIDLYREEPVGGCVPVPVRDIARLTLDIA